MELWAYRTMSKGTNNETQKTRISRPTEISTDSMEQRLSSEAESHSASQEIPAFYENRRFIILFRITRH
jgi:hypothetical protein